MNGVVSKKFKAIARKRYRRRSRIRYHTSPLIETLRIVKRRISDKCATVKSVKQFRKEVLAICNDDKLWEDIEQLGKTVKRLKDSVDNLGL